MDSIIKDFLERVHSFQVDLWFSLSKGLCPYKLARQGFVCTGFFQVQCVQCQASLALDPSALEHAADLSSLLQESEAFLLRLPKVHLEDCLYNNNREQQKLLRIKKHYLIRHWRTHYQANLESFPKENVLLPPLDPSFSALVPSQVLQTFLHEDSFDAQQILAIFGWAYQQNDDNSCLFCGFCGRRVSLSDYCLVSARQSLEGKGGEGLDVVNSHRWYCKWGRVDERGDKVYGWSICVNFLQEAVDQQQDKQLYFDRQKEARRIQEELSCTLDTLKSSHESFLKRFGEIKQMAGECSWEEGRLEGLLERRRAELGERMRAMEQAVVKKVKL